MDPQALYHLQGVAWSVLTVLGAAWIAACIGALVLWLLGAWSSLR